jgi:hypothetical protein
VGISIIISALFYLFNKEIKIAATFKYEEMPHMKPIRIPTKGKGFWKGIWLWLMTTRKWEITKDFHYTVNSAELIIPAGFIFNGASVPKFLRTWVSPVGVLLVGGLIHDYGYMYQTLLRKNKKDSIGVKSQKDMDIIFRDVNILINGFRVLNYIAYYLLRLGGFVMWRIHRKRNRHWREHE